MLRLTTTGAVTATVVEELVKLTVQVCPAAKAELNNVIYIPSNATLGMTAAGSGGGLSHPHPASTIPGLLPMNTASSVATPNNALLKASRFMGRFYFN